MESETAALPLIVLVLMEMNPILKQSLLKLWISAIQVLKYF